MASIIHSLNRKILKDYLEQLTGFRHWVPFDKKSLGGTPSYIIRPGHTVQAAKNERLVDLERLTGRRINPNPKLRRPGVVRGELDGIPGRLRVDHGSIIRVHFGECLR